MPDEELLALARQAPEGDFRAFDQIVVRHQSRVVANCRYLVRDAAEAEDLAQEVFVKAFFGLKSFQGRSTFKTWLQRIKINHCLNHIKKREGKTFVDVDDPHVAGSGELSVDPDAERHATAIDERQVIEQILDAMTDTLRIPLIMRDMDHLSYQEIADTLGIGLSAVKMRIKRAREEFRRRYDQIGLESIRGAES
jgi:RNA polymerase sigma-70 factor (ECF subfamily)